MHRSFTFLRFLLVALLIVIFILLVVMLVPVQLVLGCDEFVFECLTEIADLIVGGLEFSIG